MDQAHKQECVTEENPGKISQAKRLLATAKAFFPCPQPAHVKRHLDIGATLPIQRLNPFFKSMYANLGSVIGSD